MFICKLLFYISIFFCVRSADLPLEENLKTYLDALKRASDFFAGHAEQMNIHSVFALSITNVNFQLVFSNYPDIKATIKKQMKTVVDLNQVSVDEYLRTTSETMPQQYKAITTLFNNVTPSAKHLNEFTFKYRPYNRANKVRYILYNKPYYEKAIKELKTISPNQKLSNICLAALAEHPVNKKSALLGCPISRECSDVLRDGSDYGYALSHKILWTALSRYGRGCTILTPSEDKVLEDTLCGKAYTEIEFLIWYEFEIGKVMFDFMCTCSLLGHAEFLQRPWLNKSLDLQTSSGCFKASSKDKESEAETSIISKCDHHTTSVSICFLSAAVRYILQNYRYYPF